MLVRIDSCVKLIAVVYFVLVNSKHALQIFELDIRTPAPTKKMVDS